MQILPPRKPSFGTAFYVDWRWAGCNRPFSVVANGPASDDRRVFACQIVPAGYSEDIVAGVHDRYCFVAYSVYHDGASFL